MTDTDPYDTDPEPNAVDAPAAADAHPGIPEATTGGAVASKSRAAHPAASKRGGGSDKAVIRRVLGKYLAVTEAPKPVIAITAGLLQCGDDPEELTVAILTAPAGGFTAATDLFAVADADPFEAAVTALALGRDRMRAAWALLAAVDPVAPANMPAVDVKAATALARAGQTVADRTGAARRTIQQALDLARKR